MRLNKFYLSLLCAIAIAALLTMRPQSTRAFDGEAYAIKGGTVVTVTGETIKNGVIVVRNGLIAAVGAGIPVPADARVIDATGMTVYPGLFDSLSGYGIRPPAQPQGGPGAGGGDPIQMIMAQMAAPPSSAGLLPETTVVDQLQVNAETFDQQRAAGITTALTAPRTGVFQGQSALINLGGDAAEKLILKAPVSLNVGFSGARGGYPNSAMGVFAFLRQSLLDAQHYRETWARYNKSPRGAERPQVNKSLAALQPVINGEMPVIFNVTSVREIKRAVELAEEFKLKYMLAGATQSYQLAEYLKSKNATVILSLSFPQKPAGLEDPEDEALRTMRDRAEAPKAAAELHKAGVRFAFTSGTLVRPADYLVNAQRAVEAGLPKEVALKAMTIFPAEIFGVSEQLGSIEKGKIANLVLASGDLLEKNSRVRHVFVDGKLFEIKAPVAPPAGGRGGGNARPGGAPPPSGGGLAAGVWKLSISSPMGTREATATLSQDGEAITGTLALGMGSATINSGKLAGNELTLEITLDFGGRTVPGKLTGKIDGNTLTGAMNIMGRDSQVTGTKEPKE
ncbi:MAG: amidohydrolase family protein [Blastocatellia bacterium]|nr:amidohydrolase family protein [Blastocatellia bacterium]